MLKRIKEFFLALPKEQKKLILHRLSCVAELGFKKFVNAFKKCELEDCLWFLTAVCMLASGFITILIVGKIYVMFM